MFDAAASSAPEAVRRLSHANETIHPPGRSGAVALYRAGRGRPVLCLHAIAHGSGDFAPLAERVGDRFEILAPDWPGHGPTPAGLAPPRAEAYATLALELVETLRLERPLLLGCSIGGAAALIAAHRAPERFSGLVLCNPGGLAPVNGLARLVTGRMSRFFQAGARGARWFDRAYAAYYRRLVLPGAPERAEEIIRAGRAFAPLLAEAWAGFGEPGADLRPLALKTRLPVWLAWARSDRFIAWRRSKPAARRFPNHRLTMFEGGHAAFLEAPDAFAQGLAAFAAEAP